MNSEQLLQELEQKIRSGELSSKEVEKHLKKARSASADHKQLSDYLGNITAAKMLYVLGGAISLLGVLFLVAQIWPALSILPKFLLTFGLGFIFALLGSYLFVVRPKNPIGSVFHTVGGVLMPSGIFILLDELGISSALTAATIFMILAFFYAMWLALQRQAVLYFFLVVFLTSSIVIYVTEFAQSLGVTGQQNIALVLYVLIGGIYLTLAKRLTVMWARPISGLLSFAGTVMLLGAPFSRMMDSGVAISWVLVYCLALLGMYGLAIKFKSKMMLILSTIFLIVFMMTVTARYFSDSLGWPISLLLLGFAMLGAGYVSVEINNKLIDEA